MAIASAGAPISIGNSNVNLSPTIMGISAYTANVYVFTSPFVNMVGVILKEVIKPGIVILD